MSSRSRQQMGGSRPKRQYYKRYNPARNNRYQYREKENADPIGHRADVRLPKSDAVSKFEVQKSFASAQHSDPQANIAGDRDGSLQGILHEFDLNRRQFGDGGEQSQLGSES